MWLVYLYFPICGLFMVVRYPIFVHSYVYLKHDPNHRYGGSLDFSSQNSSANYVQAYTIQRCLLATQLTCKRTCTVSKSLQFKRQTVLTAVFFSAPLSFLASMAPTRTSVPRGPEESSSSVMVTIANWSDDGRNMIAEGLCRASSPLAPLGTCSCCVQPSNCKSRLKVWNEVTSPHFPPRPGHCCLPSSVHAGDFLWIARRILAGDWYSLG